MKKTILLCPSTTFFGNNLQIGELTAGYVYEIIL